MLAPTPYLWLFTASDNTQKSCLFDVTSTDKVTHQVTDLGQAMTFDCIQPLFHLVITAALSLAGTVAVFFIIWAGVKYITSGGDAKGVEGAKKTLTWAIIGLLIVFFSFAIINFLAFVTGSHCLTQFGFQVCNQ